MYVLIFFVEFLNLGQLDCECGSCGVELLIFVVELNLSFESLSDRVCVWVVGQWG